MRKSRAGATDRRHRSRLDHGIIGASNTVITSEDIQRSPAQTLPDILSREPGIQVQHLLRSTRRAQWCRSARFRGLRRVEHADPGRRPPLSRLDLQGFDLSSIPLDSIDVSKSPAATAALCFTAMARSAVRSISSSRKDRRPLRSTVSTGLAGSFNYWEGRASAAVTSGPWSVGAFGNAIDSNGYRVNSALRQRNVNATLNYATPTWVAISPSPVIVEFQGLPAGLNNLPGSLPYTLEKPWQSNTPARLGQETGHQLCDRVQRDP